MTLVLDASVTIAWFADEPARSQLDEVMLRIQREGAFVPSLWRTETGNSLLQLVRRGRIPAGKLPTIIEEVRRLPVMMDVPLDDEVWGAALALAERHRLTLYDATYLELAVRRRLPLASLDQELLRAATAEGVATLPA